MVPGFMYSFQWFDKYPKHENAITTSGGLKVKPTPKQCSIISFPDVIPLHNKNCYCCFAGHAVGGRGGEHCRLVPVI